MNDQLLNSQDEGPEEAKLRALLHAAEREAAPLDAAVLERLRGQSLEVFRAHAGSNLLPQTRRRFVTSRTFRALAVAAGILAFVWIAWTTRQPPTVVSLSDLERALTELASADSLHARLVAGSKTRELLAQQRVIRWENGDGTYDIQDSEAVWEVDEKANRVRSRGCEDIFWRMPIPNIDAVFRISPKESALYPYGYVWAGVSVRDGVSYEAFKKQIGSIAAEVEIEVLIKSETKKLHSLATKLVHNGRAMPLMELTILALNQPVDDEKFIVKGTLTEDGRIGKVTAAQGVVAVRPVAQERWTPVQENFILKPGDWLRTEVRGANAAAVRLVKTKEVILGPGSLAELVSPTEIRLHAGELEISVPKGERLELRGPGQQRSVIQGRQRFRLERDRLVVMAQEPGWLKGFKGSTTHESLGSLIAVVDGRNVPLTVGYHKVSVDIRDQIARTTIEESFVNHTDGQLEGTFYFPLPADASISGFGMWIGDSLVEADIVEKQRAREIYETILREKRDPGLLEWSGGNIFKARVFPIFPLAEKRIRIVYTQVLPLRANRYRYSYALQSELLQQNPLRELAIDVKVNSAVPLKTVTCPTHTARIRQTTHSAQVEFTAQEYRPARDFEVVFEIDARQNEVVLIPHRRGDDGYFMLQLTPPGTGDGWERPLLAFTEPVHILVLVDTSGSMDASQRAQQAAFLNALLTALTPRDSINLAACDVDCSWVFEKPKPATAETSAKIKQFLAGRVSLGWTDLDRAFAAAFKMAAPPTHIVYLGDGVVTTGDVDAAAFVRRLGQLHPGDGLTCHAISLGSSYEAGVLKAIGSLGGGSVRAITGERGPSAVALDLLHEITQPALRDLRIEFKGIRTARLYPQVLPNVALGSQHILLGRYLPDNKAQAGEVVITGTLGASPVQYRAPVTLKDTEQGNSFIPRLWARFHLESLLEQGTSQTIKDEIVALSEEYQIMTPYTSFLVLESDADRQRFKVKRQFRMRDGEKFFAAGLDNANYDLVQQQMRKAGNWRLGLRKSILAQLAAMGRDLPLGPPVRPLENLGVSSSTALGAAAPGLGGRVYDFSLGRELAAAGEPAMTALDGLLGDREARLDEGDSPRGPSGPESLGKLSEEADKKERVVDNFLGRAEAAVEESLAESDVAGKMLMAGVEYGYVNSPRGLTLANEPEADFGGFAGRARFLSPGWVSRPVQWLDQYFPQLPPPLHKDETYKSTWPAAAREIAKSLLRTDKLHKLSGGLRIARTVESFDPINKELASLARKIELYSPRLWLTRAEADNDQTRVQWCDGKERGVYSRAFQLGRIRTAVTRDLSIPPLELADHSLTPLDRSYAGYQVEIQPVEKVNFRLVLRPPHGTRSETRVLIDRGRQVVLSIEHRNAGKLTARTSFEDFVRVADTWWARRVETFDDKGQLASRTSQATEALAKEPFEAAVRSELADRAAVLFIKQPLPSLYDAKRALAQPGEPAIDVPIALITHFAASQQWSHVAEQLKLLERLSADKPGFRWIRNAVLDMSRRHEELKQLLGDEARRLAQSRPPAVDEHFLAEHVMGQAGRFHEANEVLRLLESLQAIYDRQARHIKGSRQWKLRRLALWQQVGRVDDALAGLRALAAEYPLDYNVQYRYGHGLFNAGESELALAHLAQVLRQEDQWRPWQAESLRGLVTNFYESQGRWDELIGYLMQWTARRPESVSPYSQYLSALVRGGRIEKAHQLMQSWFKEWLETREQTPAGDSRLQAAISLALGRGHNLYTNVLDDRWHSSLSQIVAAARKLETHVHYAAQIMQHHGFSRTDACRKLRREFLQALLQDMARQADFEIPFLVEWILPDDPRVPPESWKQIAAALRKRWAEEKSADVRHRLGESLVRVLGARGTAAELLDFQRTRWREATDTYRTQYAQRLYDELLGRPWTAANEDEALRMLDKLSDSVDRAERLHAQVSALYRFTDRMVQARKLALDQAIKNPEKISRLELRMRHDDNLRQSRAAVADRLKREAGLQPGPFAPWLTIERLYLDGLLERDANVIARECLDFLAAVPFGDPLTADDAESGPILENVLRNRYLITATRAAATGKAAPASINRLLDYLDQGIKARPANQDYKHHKQRLLIALDRPQALEESLRDWLRVADHDSYWKLSLGYLQAERGRIQEAIRLFESVEVSDELGPQAYRALADWYMVNNRRDQHERALLAVYRTMPEHLLGRSIYAKLYPWQQPGVRPPSEVDRDVLLRFGVLFEKSTYPANYLWQLRQFYQASRDFRLVAGLADAVVGHTAGRVYPFLQGIRSVLDEVREEAAIDSVIERVKLVRPKARSAIDQRALDLLEMMAERRASELKNQAGPHTNAALAAMQRAFKLDWTGGERRLMADLLAGLGMISQTELAREQLAELAALFSHERQGNYDRLHIAQQLAVTLANYSRTQDAIDRLEFALKEYQDAHSGKLPSSANGPLSFLISYFESSLHHVRGERWLTDQLGRPVHRQQRYWLLQRLYQLYQHALSSGGTVSLGNGAALYEALTNKLQEELRVDDHNHRYAIFNTLIGTHRTAHDRKVGNPAKDLEAFAFRKETHELLARQHTNYDGIVSMLAAAMHDLAGPSKGIAFILDQLPFEPAWLKYNNQDSWSRHCATLAQWRTEARDLGSLDKRLLSFVLAELRRDLASGQQRNRIIYDRQYHHYWAAKADEFARAGEEVLAERAGSGAAVRHIAHYFFWGLGKADRAIEMLFQAHSRKLLDLSGQATLVDYLHRQGRYGESIALLQQLVEKLPDTVLYRTQLMQALFRKKRPAELRAALAAADKHFRLPARWNESAMAGLARGCKGAELFEEAVAYFRELIPLHERTQPRRGIGNGILSAYYADLAACYSGLGKTAEAVDAAAAAIVSWGPTHKNRTQALAALRQVLQKSTDLPGYAAALDRRETAESKQSPIIHKALGQVFHDRGDLARAISQLQLAAELEPHDTEAHQLLIACLDKRGEREAAITRLIQAAELSRRNIKLYQDLGRRFTQMQRSADAERAYTSIVEALPTESESHAMLAEVRQQQNRWPEAVRHWEQVGRIRELEPTGMLGLARALLHEKQWSRADEILKKLRAKPWPAHFGDVLEKTRQLEKELQEKRGPAGR